MRNMIDNVFQKKSAIEMAVMAGDKKFNVWWFLVIPLAAGITFGPAGRAY